MTAPTVTVVEVVATGVPSMVGVPTGRVAMLSGQTSTTSTHSW